MIIHSVRFIKSAVEPSHYPPEQLPEVAFAGRSNVGKSSLINALTRRKGLAKTSNAPGCTQLVNFFYINELFSLVDLPGYGFARVPAAVKKKWGPMVEAYLRGRQMLRLVILLLDIRRDPGEQDLAMVQWFEHYRIPYALVLTKIDKVSKQQLLQRRRTILESLGQPACAPVLFSTRTGAGRDELWRVIGKYILPGD